jgi:hypothetical protein
MRSIGSKARLRAAFGSNDCFNRLPFGRTHIANGLKLSVQKTVQRQLITYQAKSFFTVQAIALRQKITFRTADSETRLILLF